MSVWNWRTERERDLDEEIQSHLLLAAQDRVRNGEAAEEALLSARREFGNATIVKETAREVWGWTWIEGVLFDIRYAIRILRRTPVFTATAVVALAIGIGANTAIFSLMNSMVLQPLKAPDPDRIVVFSNGPNGEMDIASPAKYNIWRQQTGLFQDVTAYIEGGVVNLTGVPFPKQIKEMRVSAGFSRLFGVRVAHGRWFTADEDRPGGGEVAVISYEFWQQNMGSDKNVIGRSVSLSGLPHRVIGVLAAGYKADVARDQPEVWVPFQIEPNSLDHGDSLEVAARLKPGVTLQMARAQLKPIGEEYRRKYPEGLDANGSFGAKLLKDDLFEDLEQGLLIFQGVVGLVLLIACANVANLLLARSSMRTREIAVRFAAGAQRSRVIRQLLTESVVLSAAGCVPGLAIGVGGMRVLLATHPLNSDSSSPPASAAAMDWRVLTFAVGIALATGILYGIIPALRATGTNLNSALKAASGRTDTGLHGNKTRALLTIGEMTLALVLLIGSGLLIRSFALLRAINPGFETRNVVTMQMSVSGPRFQKTAAVAGVIREGARRVSDLPGTAAVGATYCMPLDCTLDFPFIISGRPLIGTSHGDTNWAPVSEGYFEAFRIPVVRGRAFSDRDDGGAPAVVVINQEMVRKYWPQGDPFKDRLLIGKGLGGKYDDVPRQIVGIAGDTRREGLDQAPKPEVYIPAAQLTDTFNAALGQGIPLAWIVRTRAGLQANRTNIENALSAASGGLPVGRVRSVEELIGRSMSDHTWNALLLSIFATLALVLAAVGIYGVMAYSVQQQTAEIGIRMALGAQAESIRNRLVGQGMRLALIGAVLGIVAAFALSRVLASELYGVKPWDPLVFVSAAVTLCCVALAAVWFPARRASRIRPLDAIRHE